MDNKKIAIIIGIIIVIIIAAVAFIMMTSTAYEKIDITPNGTTMEVPAKQLQYRGDVEGAKVWNWDEGILLAYNSNANLDFIQLTELGFNSLEEIIKTADNETIDGLTCYVVNADELLEIHVFDVIKVNYNGKFYCIPLDNETTQDHIIIFSTNKDVAVHMAQSVVYKNVYPNNTDLNKTLSMVENLTETYANDTNLSDIQSTVENKTGVDLDEAKGVIEQVAGEFSI